MDLSICVSLKNRTRVLVGDGVVLPLFLNCIDSIDQAAREAGIKVFLSIADFESDDIEHAIGALEARRDLEWKITSVAGPYSSGLGLNTAVGQAVTERLLLLDADMLVSGALFERAAEVIAGGAAYFPVCWSYKNTWHAEGWWRWLGYGNVALTRGQFDSVGGLPDYNRWGREDDDFYHAFGSHGIPVVREKGVRFYHQWHPNQVGWKQRYHELEAADNRARFR